jgi:O-antigen ligase
MSGFVFRARTQADINEDPVDAWALFRIGLVLMVALVLFLRICLRRTRWPSTLFSGVIGVFVLYPLISLISTAWSVRPPWTLYKSLEFLTDVFLLAVIVATLRTARAYAKLVNWTWILLGLLVASAWVGAIVDPADALFSDPTIRIWALPARLVGVIPVVACNELSAISAVLALVALCRLFVDPEAQNKKGWYRLLLVAAVLTLLITQTRGAYAAFLIGLFLLFILTRRYRFAAAVGISSALVGSALLLFTNFGKAAENFLLRGQSVDQASGISGRGEIWQDSFSKILEHPWLGYGGFAGARFAVFSQNSIGASSLNSYIDSALNIGLWGPVILFIVVFAVGWSLLRSIDGSELSRVDSSLALEMFMAFIIILVSSFESGDLVTHPPLFFLTILGAAEILRFERKSLRMEILKDDIQGQESFIATRWNESSTSTRPLTNLE